VYRTVFGDFSLHSPRSHPHNPTLVRHPQLRPCGAVDRNWHRGVELSDHFVGEQIPGVKSLHLVTGYHHSRHCDQFDESDPRLHNGSLSTW
jgi:hypothetical protein